MKLIHNVFSAITKKLKNIAKIGREISDVDATNILSAQSLSKRGTQATQTDLRPDLKIFFESKDDLWNADSNPGGKFPLNMAENNLCWDILKSKIELILKEANIPDWVSNYTGIGGSDSFLNAVSSLMSGHLTNCKIDKEHLAASAGATAVIELSSWILCDAGDIAVLPAPSYPVYKQDINNKAAVERYDLVTHHDLGEIIEGSYIRIEDLERAKEEIEEAGKVFKLLIITNPDNPTGSIYDETQLKEISKWCIKYKIHLLVNEIYGLSIIDTSNIEIVSDYPYQIKFTSFASIIQKQNNEYLHLVYGLSKDFGASGFRIGIIYSLNEAFLQAYRNLNAPHMVSNIAQWIFEQILEDEDFITSYIRTNQRRLTTSYIAVINTIKNLSIPYVPARGSLFVWLDFSEFLIENTLEAEQKLWQEIYDRTGILLTPGEGFGHSKKGQFRLVYSYLEYQALLAAMKALQAFVIAKRNIGIKSL